MAKLDLEWLGVFVEVYNTQSVSRAAERLDIAQASASIALNKLRRHFADPLFIRTSQGMEPTPRAAAIYPKLSAALAHLRDAHEAPTSFRALNSPRNFKLCMTDISEIVLLPTLINYLQERATGISLEAEKISSESRRRLESGELDLAVGFMPDLEAGFYQQALFAQEFVCLAAQDHPRVRVPLELDTFFAEGHLVVTTSGTGHAVVDKVLARTGRKRRVVLRVPSFLSVARVIAQTELLAVVPRMLGETLARQDRVQLLRPPLELPSYRVKQHWHERFNADPANIWLRKTFAQLFSTCGDI